jgi:dCMP deaminase
LAVDHSTKKKLAVRISRDEWALRLAEVTALRGTCLRRRVGAVLLDRDGYVLSTGFNGRAAGLPHCDERGMVDRMIMVDGRPQGLIASYPNACPGATAISGTALDLCEACHAEQNCLLRCRDVREVEACYVTVSPCVACAKLLLNTACRRVVFREEYVHADARRLWEAAGRMWICLK